MMLAVTVGAPVSGISPIKFYSNGTLFHTGAITSMNFGAVGDPYQIGYFGGGGAYSNGFHSETAVFDYELSGATIASFVAAAGL